MFSSHYLKYFIVTDALTADQLLFMFCIFIFILLSRIWNALTDNYGNVMPVDWKSSHTRALHLPTLNLSEKGVSSDQ